jgi:hypothetical protein
MIRMSKQRSRVILLSSLSVIIIIVAFIIVTYLGSQSDLVAAPGIKAGDEFTYDIKGFWSSQDHDATPSESFFELNMTELFKVTVIGVSGAEVSINTTWRFNNGTEFERASSINVETGMKYPSDAFYLIYAANLKANDFVRPLGLDRSTVNETATRQYASGTRETNRLSLVQEFYGENDPTRTWIEYTNIHFDRQTGVLVELRDTNVYTKPDVTLTLLYAIKDTNVWTI